MKTDNLPKRLTIGITIFFFLSAGLLPPVLPVSSGQAFTVGEEREVGEKLLSIVQKEFNILDDPDINDYITNLGKETLRLAGSQFFDYHFFVIDNKEFNAFAAPSGLIFIHSGLIDICDSEGELLSVLAHEIGHAACRHIADRIDKSSKVSIGTTALILAGILIGQGALSEALITGSMATGAAANLKFSRQDEEEADRLAYKWLQEQNVNPEEMVQMLDKMRRVSRYRRAKVPTYLLTHPEPENRLGYIEERILMDRSHTYPPPDNFAFKRIKYRVQTITKNTASLIPILENKASEADTAKQDIMVYYGLSQAYLENKEYQKAEDALAKVISSYPDKHILQTDLGRIYLEAGKKEAALKIFTDIDKINHQDIYNRYYLAKTLHQKGELARAANIYEELTLSMPTNSRLYYDIAQIKATLGNKALGHYFMGLYNFYEGVTPTARYHLQQALSLLEENDPTHIKSKELLAKIARLEKL
ncbi:MAG: M48 family metalloprotease [Desulfobulbaceae bacterium]|nr:M48 family metalloprotease [Desulfobulbaceae bacterium]